MARPWPAMTRSVASLISAMEMAFLFRCAARMADLIGLAQGVGGEGRILSIYLSIYLSNPIYLSIYPSLYVYMYNMYVYMYIYIYHKQETEYSDPGIIQLLRIKNPIYS